MSLGMRIPVLAPRPVARPVATALTSYFDLSTQAEYQPDERGVQRWKNGVSFTPFGCEKIVGALFDPCVERITESSDFPTIASFDPFLAEVSVECSLLQATTDVLSEYVIAHTEVSRSSILGAQVERSAYTTGNPSLASEAQALSSTDTSLLGAVVAVEEALADLLDGGVGMVHVPAGLLAVLAAEGAAMRDPRGVFTTASGHIVVGDAGSLGVSPVTGGTVAGELWIYGSGPVFAIYDPRAYIFGNPYENIDYTRNILRVDAEVHGLAIFDPCAVVAAKVNTADNDVVD